MAEATAPPMAPPDIVMVRITVGNTSAIAASASTPSRPM
jgi:predicted secreted protein